MNRNLVVFALLLVLGAAPPGMAAMLSADDAAPSRGSTTGTAAATTAGSWRIIGWNDLGMHCMDGSDSSVSSVLPPFNNIHAQVVDSNGKLVTSPGSLTITYEAVSDPAGSINKTSATKTNFWQYVQALFGTSLPFDTGLAGFRMPGPSNMPQAMKFDATHNWFEADGVPITPYDDAGQKNYYPMMRLRVKDFGGNTLATTDIVLPVSDEMDCKACHASNSDAAARPTKGWVNNSDPAKDAKYNILRMHDQKQQPGAFAALIAKAGYNAQGLEATALSGTPVLCERCHSSNALPGLGIAGVSRLTRAVHFHHQSVSDPLTGLTMDQSTNRSACYRCHPGSVTKCLRGVMGNAVDATGNMIIQCQNCHGTMSVVAKATRVGWFDEPNCQNCHTGTAVHNSGQIRYTSTFSSQGVLRAAADVTFATTANVPSSGYSLYRYSSGHGGLQCEACHGATHAEYPTSHVNDNLQSIQLQGHDGTLAECSACHARVPATVNGGPHGMHPVGQSWISSHHDVAEHNATQCQACHGTDYRGTVLSKTKTDRTFRVDDGRTVTLAKGTQISCYTCHNGPRGGD